MEIGLRMILKVRGFIYGLMVDHIQDLGRIIRFMDMEYMIGGMEINMKEITKMIKNMEKESLPILMVEYLKEFG